MLIVYMEYAVVTHIYSFYGVMTSAQVKAIQRRLKGDQQEWASKKGRLKCKPYPLRRFSLLQPNMHTRTQRKPYNLESAGPTTAKKPVFHFLEGAIIEFSQICFDEIL